MLSVKCKMLIVNCILSRSVIPIAKCYLDFTPVHANCKMLKVNCLLVLNLYFFHEYYMLIGVKMLFEKKK